MNIVSLNQDPGISPARQKGAAVHLSAMRDAFARLGHRVIAIDEPDPGAVRVRLESLLEQQNIDLIYERYALGKNAAAAFARQHSISLVVEVNAPLAQEAARYRNLEVTKTDRLSDLHLFQNAAQVVAVSPETAAYARNRGARAAITRVCPNGIDERVFHVHGRRNRLQQIERKSGGLPTPLVLGFHGRLRPWHGFDRLVLVAQQLREEGYELEISVVGTGDFETPLQARLPQEAYSISPWVKHADLGELVRRFDILPLTYRANVPCYFSPLKLAEAMACGVVPVVPDLGNFSQLVKHEVDGLVYEPQNDGATLRDAVRRLADDSKFLDKLGSAAASRAAKRTWLRVAEKIIAWEGCVQ